MRLIRIVSLIISMGIPACDMNAQCTDYNILVESGSGQISWDLYDSFGNLILSGGAPFDQDVCLPDDCYTLWKYNNTWYGWTGEVWSIENELGENVFTSFLSDGFDGTATFSIGSASCDPPCLIYNITSTDGVDAPDVYWELIDSFGILQAAGGANESTSCNP